MFNKRYFSYDFDKEYFLYDCSAGLVCNSTETVNKIVELANQGYEKKDIIKILNELDENEIERSIDALNELSKKYYIEEESQNRIRKNKSVEESLWLDGYVLDKMWLSLAHSCNMNCVYCFADEGTYGKKSLMSIETAKSCIDYFFRYANKKAKRYNVSYFGGEPLLNKAVFIFATNYINEKAKERGVDIHYTLTTNGTLLDEEILDTIIKNNIYVNISIDGSKEVHNLNRKFHNGKETFDTIMKNVNILKSHNHKDMVARVTITKPAVKTLKEDIQFLWNNGFDDVVIDTVKTDIKELAIDEDAMNLLKEQVNEIMIAMKEEILKGNLKLLRNITDMKNIIEKRIIKAECSYFNPFTVKFTPEGDIYKCEFAFGQNELCAGNVKEGIKWDKFQKNFTADEKCFKCWAKRLCGGVCYMNKDYNLVCEYSKIIIENSLKYYSFSKRNEAI